MLQSRYLLLIGAHVAAELGERDGRVHAVVDRLQGAPRRQVAAGRLAGEHQGAFIGAFYADYFQVVNIVGMLLQLFVVSSIVKFLGVQVAVCILPIVALGSYAVAALLPSLAVVRWVKTAENAVDYSLQNTVEQMLFLPTTREEKYKAKQVTDTFIVRAGDVLSSATVLVGTPHWLSHFAVRLDQRGAGVVWFAVAILVGREFRRRTAAGGRAHDRNRAGPARVTGPAWTGSACRRGSSSASRSASSSASSSASPQQRCNRSPTSTSG